VYVSFDQKATAKHITYKFHEFTPDGITVCVITNLIAEADVELIVHKTT